MLKLLESVPVLFANSSFLNLSAADSCATLAGGSGGSEEADASTSFCFEAAASFGNLSIAGSGEAVLQLWLVAVGAVRKQMPPPLSALKLPLLVATSL